MRTLIFILLVSLLIVSCKETLTEIPSIRRIINETNYQISLEVFGDDVSFKYEIKPLDTLNIVGSCFYGVENYCVLDWTTSLAYANIIFDNKRIQRFVDLPLDCAKKAINADPVTGTCYGYVKSEENGYNVYTYKITQEDYDNAEKIGG